MPLAQKFRGFVTSTAPAAALAGLLAVLPTFNGNAQGQEPAMEPNTPAAASLVSHTGPVTPSKNLTPNSLASEVTPSSQAIEFSKRGVGLYLLLKEGEDLNTYKADLAWLMRDLKKAGVPAKIFGDVTGKYETMLFGFVDGVTYGKTFRVDYGDGYSMNQMGKAASDLIRAYHEAFPNGTPRTASAHEAPATQP